MTPAQTSFVLEVQQRLDRCGVPPSRWADQLFHATVQDDDAEVARICGLMLIDLGARGEQIALECAVWLQYFGELIVEPL